MVFQGETYKAISTNYFSALNDIRKHLGVHCKIAINGSRFDFYPFNMALQMTSGKVGYILEMGKSGSIKARTFDECLDSTLLVSVEEHMHYYHRWFESLT